jgi:uracil-DNA glycosylase
VGRAGQLLNNMIKAMGLRREDVYIANVVKCRPPGNRTPERDECETCSPFLMRQIAVIKPKVMVALGADRGEKSACHQCPDVRTAWPLVRFQTAPQQRSFMAGRAPGRHLPSSISAPRPAPEGRSLEGLADGDEVPGNRASQKSRE